jgi:hypothetical protein
MRYLTLVSLALLATACGDDPAGPSAPPPATSQLTVTTVSPASGGAVVVPASFTQAGPTGAIIPPQSGLISVALSMTSATAVPYAQLNVYLLTDGPGGYCAQNLPDSPTWGQLPAGWTTSFTVSGFEVFRTPCDVTGVRAMLHTRNNGLLVPPIASETIAEATVPARFQIRR